MSVIGRKTNLLYILLYILRYSVSNKRFKSDICKNPMDLMSDSLSATLPFESVLPVWRRPDFSVVF